jgi:hypothetical protein
MLANNSGRVTSDSSITGATRALSHPDGGTPAELRKNLTCVVVL